MDASPNYQEYCYSVKAFWSTDNYGDLESRSSNVSCATPFRKGDANFDNNVDISDVLSVVNFVLESDFPTAEEFRNVDVNEDEQINIADVIKVVDIIFGVSSMRLVGENSAGLASVNLLVDHTSQNIVLAIQNGSVS